MEHLFAELIEEFRGKHGRNDFICAARGLAKVHYPNVDISVLDNIMYFENTPLAPLPIPAWLDTIGRLGPISKADVLKDIIFLRDLARVYDFTETLGTAATTTFIKRLRKIETYVERLDKK